MLRKDPGPNLAIRENMRLRICSEAASTIVEALLRRIREARALPVALMHHAYLCRTRYRNCTVLEIDGFGYHEPVG